MSRSLRITLITAIALGSLIIGTAIALLNGNTIHTGVQMSGIQLGGLTIEQAESRLGPEADKIADEQVTLKYAGETLRTMVAELGGSMDIADCAQEAYSIGREGNIFKRIGAVISARRHGLQIPIVYAFDKESASRCLHTIAQKIDRQPINARLTVKDSSVQVIPEKPGVKMNIEKSLVGITQAVNTGEREVDLVVVTAPPTLTAADLKGIDSVLSTYSTQYKPWQRDRTHNLRIACRSISGTIVKPGEVFSYNKVVGPRLKEKGFREAPMFVNGEVEPGTGGGVCQVSTTVYNAALLANMKITKRFHHSRPVAYAPVGRDATVAYPSVDLKFENTSDSPIYVLASVGSRTVNISFLGRKQDGLEVQISSGGHRVTSFHVIEKPQENIKPGKRVELKEGLKGHSISTYRIVKINGEVVKRETISQDYYRPQNRVIAVPKPVEESTPEQDETTVPVKENS